MRVELRSMKSITLIVLAILAVGVVASGAAGQTLDVDAMAVYAQGRAVIQETRTLTLQPGFNEVELVIPDGLIVPSLLLQSEADILWTRFHPARRLDLLTEAVGLTVEVIDRTGAMYRGELVAQSDGILLRQESGGMILVADPVTLRLSDGAAVALNENAELIVGVSSVAGGEVSLDMLYIVSGISWEASYAVFVSEESELGSLQTKVAVTNGAGGIFSTPALSLIAGDVYVEQPAMYEDMVRVSALAFEANAPAGFAAEGVSEYYRYTLPFPVTLESDGMLALSYARSETVRLIEEFVYDTMVSGDVQIQYSFENDVLSGLDIPLPAGTVRVYQIDEIGPVLLGEDSIPHTAAGDTVELQVGSAFDLEASRTLLERTWISDDRYQEQVEIVLENAKSESVTVSVSEHPSGYTWNILGATLPYESVDANTVRFDVSVPPEGEAIVRYTVEYAY